MAIDYRQSGVDVEEGYRAVGKYKAHAKRTSIPGVLNGLGSFAGMFEVPAGMKNPVMVSGTDGVGTKLDIAFEMKKYALKLAALPEDKQKQIMSLIDMLEG